ncbi:MAG: cell division protein ZapA [Bacteroidales bacterium]|nr:cell division protein ZapA [Bacteroidales bacterium]
MEERQVDNINITIIGKEYHFKVKSPSDEHLYREAADSINKVYASVDASHPGLSMQDKLVVTALSMMVRGVSDNEKVSGIRSEIESLQSRTDAYLAGIED